MQAPTVRVFLSSTWLDLEPERKAVEAVIHRMRETKFVGMEYCGSRDETTRRASLDEVDRSEVYVVIFGARYGSGITEDEYRRARERELPCFIYFKDDATITDEGRETDAKKTERLNALKQDLRHSHISGPEFTNPGDLAAKVTADLHRWLFDEHVPRKLEQAALGQVPHAEAQTLLDAVKDVKALNQDLLARLKSAGYTVAQGDVVWGDKIIYEAPAQSTALEQLVHLLGRVPRTQEPVVFENPSTRGEKLPPRPKHFRGRKQELVELHGLFDFPCPAVPVMAA